MVRQHHTKKLPTINYQDTEVINIKITQPTITVANCFRLRTTTHIQVLYTSIIQPFPLKLVTSITYVTLFQNLPTSLPPKLLLHYLKLANGSPSLYHSRSLVVQWNDTPHIVTTLTTATTTPHHIIHLVLAQNLSFLYYNYPLPRQILTTVILYT